MFSTNPLHLNPLIAKHFNCFNFSCCGLLICLLAIHFIYRYFAVCKTTWLLLFEKPYCIMWMVLFFLFGAEWYSVAVFLGDGSKGNCPLESIPIQERMHVEFDRIVYTGFRYFIENNGKYDLCVNGIFYSIILLKIVFLSGSIVLYCGIRTYREMARKRQSTSRKTHDMQRQLFKALVVQTIIPSLLLYVPLITMFVAPIFQWDLDNIDALLLFSFVFYPILDPLAVLYLIGDYKKAIKTMFDEYIVQNLVKFVKVISKPQPNPQATPSIIHIPMIVPSSPGILY